MPAPPSRRIGAVSTRERFSWLVGNRCRMSRLIQTDLTPAREFNSWPNPFVEGEGCTGSGVSSGRRDELECQMVKSAPHVVEAVAQSSCEVWVPRGGMICPIDVLRTTVVHSALEGVSAEVVKIPDRLLEGIAVCWPVQAWSLYLLRWDVGSTSITGRCRTCRVRVQGFGSTDDSPTCNCAPKSGSNRRPRLPEQPLSGSNRMFPHTQSWCI